MKDLRRIINELLINMNLTGKDYFYLGLIVFIIVLFKFSTIFWWGIIIILFWLGQKFFAFKKKYLDDDIIDKFCREHPENVKCQQFNESKKTYKNLIEDIKMVK